MPLTLLPNLPCTVCPPVPFEEDDKDPSIWFLDHSYLENMFRMFKKVNGACCWSRTRPHSWHSCMQTGPGHLFAASREACWQSGAQG